MASSSVSPSTITRTPSPKQSHHDLNFSDLPPLYIISNNIPIETLHDIEEELIERGALLASEGTDTNLFVAKVGTKKRAQFELRHAGVWTEELPVLLPVAKDSKKRKLDDDSGAAVNSRRTGQYSAQPVPPLSRSNQFHLPDDEVIVIKLKWLEDSLQQKALFPIHDYILYRGQRINKEGSVLPKRPHREDPIEGDLGESQADAILDRARADTPPASTGRSSRFISAPHGSRRFLQQGHGHVGGSPSKRPKLLEMETVDDEPAEYLPPVPMWVRKGLKYACQRIHLDKPPNDEFIELLKKIRLARILTGDEIGVRAYSSSIAAIAAITTKFISPREVVRLPGCDIKIANLWVEYHNEGDIKAAKEVDTDETLKLLQEFYNIWGVGEKTAREFYYDRGWRDLDDILDYGWDTLSRVQQIGLKYYDEFKQGIPRKEVEFILEKVREHAIKVRDDGIEAMVVGGYRRGKEESGDVDVVVSHRDLDKTEDLVTDIVTSLEEEGWITHTLTLALTASHRGQNTLPFRGGAKVPGSGFDTLDKALVVWQDPHWSTKEQDLKKNPKAKNPNIHRRVDIIISPWRTVGCAVLGWSGGNTFQRDLRRYAKYIKDWKFDSSGIRSRRTGEVVMVEGPNGVEGNMIDAEKAVFEGMGLEYREPFERCTG